MRAGIAGIAVYLRLNRDLLSDAEFIYSLAQLHYLSGDLMSLSDRIRGKRMFPVVYMNVTASDTDLFNLHQYLIRAGLRHRNLPECDLSRFCHKLLQHIFLLQSGTSFLNT